MRLDIKDLILRQMLQIFQWVAGTHKEVFVGGPAPGFRN